MSDKEKIMNAPVSSGNEGRLAHDSMQVPNTTQPKDTNSETHGQKQDIANTESNGLNPASHGKQGSNSQKA